MLLFRKTADSETVEGYVATLEQRLQSELPTDKAEQIVQETHAHLSDRVDDLIDTGLTRPEAEAVALSGFGTVKRYARVAVETAYGGRYTTTFRLIGRLAAVNFLAVSMCSKLLPEALYTQISAQPFFDTFISTVALLVPLAAFGARRAQTRTYSVYFALATLLLFIGGGVRYVPYPATPTVLWAGFDNFSPYETGPGQQRGDYSQEIAALKNRWVYREVRLLEQGLAYYNTGETESKTVPASLRYKGRYIVPDTKYGEYGAKNALLAFQEPAFMAIGKESWGQWVARVPHLPYHTVSSQAEATRVWHTVGPVWLIGKHQEAANVDRQRKVLEQTQNAPLGFNLAAATYFASGCLLWCAPLVLIPDLLLAHLGRAVWMIRHSLNRRREQTT